MFSREKRRITNKDILKRRQSKTRLHGARSQAYQRIGSFAFFIAIPAFFLLTFLIILALIGTFISGEHDSERAALFLIGLIGSIFIVSSTRWPKLFILLHELKHAFVVIVTGNKLEAIKVSEDSGYVSYATYEDSKHLVPFIVLAPYCFPLFSFPLLTLATFIDLGGNLMTGFIVGCALGIDLATGYRELHPFQTDFRKIFGGFVLAASFIAGITMCWSLFCLLWSLKGSETFIYLGYLVFDLAKHFIAELEY